MRVCIMMGQMRVYVGVDVDDKKCNDSRPDSGIDVADLWSY